MMDKPKLEDYKREVYDGADYADWYEEYYKALEKYTEELESQLTASRTQNAELVGRLRKIRGAVVEEVTPVSVKVRYGTGLTDVDNIRGINKPVGVIVGDVGVVEYKTAGSYGLPFFKKNETALRSAGQQTGGE